VVGGLIGAAALLVAGCSGGGGGSGSGGGSGGGGGGSRAAYCQAFKKDWPTLDAAKQKDSDAWWSMQGPMGDDASTVSEQLVADHAVYESAASSAAALAQAAPTKLKNDITTDSENA
jgi:hypothetical protein